MGRITKIFITHMHGDHVFGLGALLSALLGGGGHDVEADAVDRTDPETPLEIYGPYGLRPFVRSLLRLTGAAVTVPFVVHELHFNLKAAVAPIHTGPLYRSERPDGRNMLHDGQERWHNVFASNDWSIHAASLRHTAPCVGYVLNEAPRPGKIDMAHYAPLIKAHADEIRSQLGFANPLQALSILQRGESVRLAGGVTITPPSTRPGRQLVILGDTFDPSNIAPLTSQPTLLIHEATNCFLPSVDLAGKDVAAFSPDELLSMRESVRSKCVSHGHSTPDMAGAFARSIGAQRLILNHFSSRYRGDVLENAESAAIMNEMASLAADAYGQPVECAYDFMQTAV